MFSPKRPRSVGKVDLSSTKEGNLLEINSQLVCLDSSNPEQTRQILSQKPIVFPPIKIPTSLALEDHQVKYQPPSSSPHYYYYIKHGVKTFLQAASDVLNIFDFSLPPTSLTPPESTMANGFCPPIYAWSPHSTRFAVSMVDGTVAIGNASGIELSSPHGTRLENSLPSQSPKPSHLRRPNAFRPFLKGTPSLRQTNTTPVRPQHNSFLHTNTPNSMLSPSNPLSFQSPIRPAQDSLSSAVKAFQPLSAIKPKPHVLFSPALVSQQDITPFPDEEFSDDFPGSSTTRGEPSSISTEPRLCDEWLVTTLKAPHQHDIINLSFSPVDGGILAVATRTQGVFLWFLRPNLSQTNTNTSGDGEDAPPQGWVVHIPPPSQRQAEIYNELSDIAWTPDGKELIISYKDTGYMEFWNILYTTVPNSQAFIYFFDQYEPHDRYQSPVLRKASDHLQTTTTSFSSSHHHGTDLLSPLDQLTAFIFKIFSPPKLLNQQPPHTLRSVTLPHSVLKLYPSPSSLVLVSHTGSDGFSLLHLTDLSYEVYQTWNQQPVSGVAWSTNTTTVLLTAYYSSILMQVTIHPLKPPPNVVIGYDTPAALVTGDDPYATKRPAGAGAGGEILDPLSISEQIKAITPPLILDVLGIQNTPHLRYIDLYKIESNVILNIAHEDITRSPSGGVEGSFNRSTLQQHTKDTIALPSSYIGGISWDPSSHRLAVIVTPLPKGIESPVNTAEEARVAKDSSVLRDSNHLTNLMSKPSSVLLFETLAARKYVSLTIIGAISLPPSQSSASKRKRAAHSSSHGDDDVDVDDGDDLHLHNDNNSNKDSNTLPQGSTSAHNISYSLPSIYPTIPASLKSSGESDSHPAPAVKPWPVRCVFHPNFDKGSLLSLLWSNGVNSFIPLYHRKDFKGIQAAFSRIDQSDAPGY